MACSLSWLFSRMSPRMLIALPTSFFITCSGDSKTHTQECSQTHTLVVRDIPGYWVCTLSHAQPCATPSAAFTLLQTTLTGHRLLHHVVLQEPQPLDALLSPQLPRLLLVCNDPALSPWVPPTAVAAVLLPLLLLLQLQLPPATVAAAAPSCYCGCCCCCSLLLLLVLLLLLHSSCWSPPGAPWHSSMSARGLCMR
jgi:hypothetical protein